MKETLFSGPIRGIVECESSEHVAGALMLPRGERKVIVFGDGVPRGVRRIEHPESLVNEKFTEVRICAEFREWPMPLGCRR